MLCSGTAALWRACFLWGTQEKVTLYHCSLCQYGWIGICIIGTANHKMRKIQGFTGLPIQICSTPFAYDEHKADFSLHCQLSHWIFPYSFPFSPLSWLVFTRASTLSRWTWMMRILLFPPGIRTGKWRPKFPLSVFFLLFLLFKTGPFCCSCWLL